MVSNYLPFLESFMQVNKLNINISKLLFVHKLKGENNESAHAFQRSLETN